MKSHQFAKRLREMAEILEARTEFEMPSEPHAYQNFYDKDEFVAAARALGAGKKTFTTGAFPELQFVPNALPEMQLYINRDKVCRRIQSETWECEPMLSPTDEKELIVAEAEGMPF